jgi:Patatin-like phospholipase
MRQRPQALSQSQTLIWRAVMKTVANLAFKGGGVLGAAYVGALQALEEYKLAGSLKPTKGSPIVYGNVKRVAGTSAGAICAALVALGNNAKEIDGIMDSMKFTDLVDVDPDFPANGGLCLGINFLNWMESQVKAIMDKDHATFTDLSARAQNNPLYKDLHVFSHQLSAAPGATQDVALVFEIIAALGVAWALWEYNGDIEAAIEEFEKLLKNWVEKIPGWDELVKFVKLVELWGSAIGSVLNTPTNFVFERDAQRSIVLNTLGYSFIDFWMPECNKMKLRAAGYNSAEKYLSLIMYS